MRIVPPAMTVTFEPSPKALTASSGEVGARTWVSCRDLDVTRRFLLEGDTHAILSPCAERTQTPAASGVRPARVIVRGMAFATIDELEAGLRGATYLPERGLATALYLSLTLE